MKKINKDYKHNADNNLKLCLLKKTATLSLKNWRRLVELKIKLNLETMDLALEYLLDNNSR